MFQQDTADGNEHLYCYISETELPNVNEGLYYDIVTSAKWFGNYGCWSSFIGSCRFRVSITVLFCLLLMLLVVGCSVILIQKSKMVGESPKEKLQV